MRCGPSCAIRDREVSAQIQTGSLCGYRGGFFWYEQQRVGLGAEFETELNRTFGYVADMPLAGRVVHRGLRRALLRRFPFAVYFTVIADLIEIRGVLHNRRHPRTWLRRA